MPLTIDIMDVGQGDGIFVTFPKGQTMMVDLGSLKNKKIVADSVFNYFANWTNYKKGPGQELTWLVLTHADSDHYNLITEFVEKFQPKILNIVHGGAPADYTGKDGKNLVDWVREWMASKWQINTTPLTGTQDFPFQLGSEQNFGGANVQILCMSHAVNGSVAHVKNSKSVVLRIAYAGEVAMLTGDATEATEEAILKTYKTKNKNMGELVTDVLKVAHHGSRRTSNRVPWIKAVNPWFLFVSSDRWGLLDEDEDPTGHRLPQQLTFDLYARHANRLTKSALPHDYVASYQLTDYESYNANPDVMGDKVELRDGPKLLWLNNNNKLGIFTTLAWAGQGQKDPDLGVHYQAQIGDNGGIEVYATDIFSDPKPRLQPVDIASKKK